MTLSAFAVSLGLTLLLELPVAWLWGLRSRHDWMTTVLVNVLTNPAAVLLYPDMPDKAAGSAGADLGEGAIPAQEEAISTGGTAMIMMHACMGLVLSVSAHKEKAKHMFYTEKD